MEVINIYWLNRRMIGICIMPKKREKRLSRLTPIDVLWLLCFIDKCPHPVLVEGRKVGKLASCEDPGCNGGQVSFNLAAQFEVVRVVGFEVARFVI